MIPRPPPKSYMPRCVSRWCNQVQSSAIKCTQVVHAEVRLAVVPVVALPLAEEGQLEAHVPDRAARHAEDGPDQPRHHVRAA